jgi:hypothetical protein
MRKFIDIVSSPISVPLQQNSLMALLEAAKAYEEMMDAAIRFFDNIPVDYDRGAYIRVANQIKGIAKWLGNGRNCATWFTRYYRAALMKTLLGHFAPQSGSMDQDVWQKIDGYCNKIVSEYERQTSNVVPLSDLGTIANHVNMFKEQMEHFRTIGEMQPPEEGQEEGRFLPYGPIANYHFDQQTPTEALNQLRDFERVRGERMSASENRKIVPLPEDTIALKCKDGFAWWLLDRNKCEQERGAMSHCGNTASPRAGQRILSLRQHAGQNEHGQDIWIPHCTFIWNPDGTLGERKGFNNHKPSPAFYPYITELFKQPWIKGLVGGAHAADRDIKLEDLTKAEQKAILATNPQIVPVRERIALEGITKEIAEEIADGVKKIGPDWFRLRGFKLDDLPPEQKEKLFSYAPELMSEKDYYEKYGLDAKMIDLMVHGFKREGKDYINKLPFISQEDKNTFFTKHPEFMNDRDYYAIHGLDAHLMGMISKMTEKTGSGKAAISQLGLSMLLTDEDKEKLYAHYPETQPLSEWIAKDGMSEPVMAYIHNSVNHHKRNWWYNQDIKLNQLPEADRFKLWDRYPDMMNLEERYERHGLDEIVVLGILHGLNNGDESIRSFIGRLKEEDRERLYQEHPETMPARVHYQRYGLTPQLKTIILSGLKASGVRWFDDNYLWPDGTALGAIKPMWMSRSSYASDATVLSPEDTIKLFSDDPDLFVLTLPQVYYKKYGMDARLKEYLASQARTQGYGHAIGHAGGAVPTTIMPKKHLHDLLDTHPDLHTPKDYYTRNGLTPEFARWLGSRHPDRAETYGYGRIENHIHQPKGMDWSRMPSHFDIRKDLKKGDLEKVFKAYPNLMTMKEHYARLGLDKALLKDIKEGWDEEGPGSFFSSDFKPEDDLKKKDLVALYRKWPFMMPFQRQIQVLPVRSVVKNMQEQIDRLYDSSALGDHQWDGKNKRFIIQKWSTMGDFLEEWGDDSIKHYAGEDPFDHWGGDEEDADSMDSVLPAMIKLCIGKYAKKEYGQEPDEDDEDDFDYEDVDPLDWNEVKSKLEENDDPVYDALKVASAEGARIGAESDAMEAVQAEVLGANRDLEWGEFDVPTYKDGKGKLHVAWEGDFIFSFKYEEMAKWLDTCVDGSDNSPDTTDMSEFLKSKLSVRDNFYGFDEDAALDRFLDECPEEALEGRVHNPFWGWKTITYKRNGKLRHGGQKKVWKKLSAQQMRSALDAIFETGVGQYALKWMKRDYDALDPNDLNGLKALFQRITEEFYG